MFYSQFWGCGCKNIQEMQGYPRKKFLETLNWFSQPELPGKKERPNNIYLPVTSHDLFNYGKTLPFSGNSGWENKLEISKHFFMRIGFCIC